MRKRNIALILAASMMATFAFGGTTAFAAEEGKTDSVTVGIMADPEIWDRGPECLWVVLLFFLLLMSICLPEKTALHMEFLQRAGMR